MLDDKYAAEAENRGGRESAGNLKAFMQTKAQKHQHVIDKIDTLTTEERSQYLEILNKSRAKYQDYQNRVKEYK